MKKLLFLCFAIAYALNIYSQAPDFSCVGFAAENGGTTGGKGGQEVTVTNLEDFKKYVSEKDQTPRVIYVKGTLKGSGGGEVIAIGSNKSIIGIGDEAKVLKVQFYCKNSKNLIIQNLFFSMEGSTLGSDADCISIATTGSDKCQNIWIDHCTFDNNVQPISKPSASQKDQYDGLLDIKKSSEFITISWCVFKNHYKGILVGYTDSDTYDRKITMHHNAFINISSRTPSYRGGTAHIYNNYWEGSYDSSVGKYFSTGVNTREGACLLVESNYFKNMNKTVYCALDDVKFEGFASYRNNILANSTAEEATICDSFTPPYTVVIEDANTVESTVKQYAGVGVVKDPENIPEPEGETPSALTSPSLNEAYNISDSGFEVNWNEVDGAKQYVVSISFDSETEGNADIFHESFNHFTTSNVTKHGLTSGLTDNDASAFTEINGGTRMICDEDGTMLLDAGRFCIAGLDLSSNPTLELKYKWVSGTGKLQVGLDISGTSGAGNMYSDAADIAGAEYKTIYVPLNGGTASSFIQIRVESKTVIIIDDIRIVGDQPGTKTNTTTHVVYAPATNFVATGLDKEVEYTVQVVAKNDTDESKPSNKVQVTTTDIGNSIENDVTDIAEVITVENNVIVLKETGNYRVHSLSGKLLSQGNSSSTNYEVSANLNKGFYVVTLNGKAAKVAIK